MTAESHAQSKSIPDITITASDLIAEPGRLGSRRLRCPHPECPWWVPEDRAHLADSHVCCGPVYDTVDKTGLVETDASTTPEEYVGNFTDVTGQVDLVALAEDAIPRPRSERIRLLFGFDAFDYQRAILDDPNPDVSVNTGRQVGKTETGGAIGADAVLFSAYPTDDDVAFFGDVQDTAVEMFRRCTRHLENCPIPLEQLGVDRDNETFWEFDNGTRLLTGSLNNGGDNERGKLPKVVVADEAALCERSSFEDVVDPMFMTHGDDHELYVVSTPRGETGYHYDAHQPDRQPAYFSSHSVPAWANPLVDETWLEKKRASTDSDTWRQEYLGEFVPEGNAYIPPSLYRPVQTDLPTQTTQSSSLLRVDGHPYTNYTYFGGVDIAGQGSDKTVYIVMTDTGTVIHIESEEKSRTNDVVGRIGELHEHYGFEQVCVDQNALGQGVADYAAADTDLSGVVVGVPFSTPKKSEMYKNLKNAFETEALSLPKHGALERETTHLQYSFTSNRHVAVSHPPNGHDDFPDALALCQFARSGKAESRPQSRFRFV